MVLIYRIYRNVRKGFREREFTKKTQARFVTRHLHSLFVGLLTTIVPTIASVILVKNTFDYLNGDLRGIDLYMTLLILIPTSFYPIVGWKYQDFLRVANALGVRLVNRIGREQALRSNLQVRFTISQLGLYLGIGWLLIHAVSTISQLDLGRP